MSKHNRERRQQYWKCLQCGERMHRELLPAAKAALARVPGKEILHMCGKCKMIHLETDGELRRPTAQEMFSIQMECGNTLAHLDRVEFAACDNPTGTLILPRG